MNCQDDVGAVVGELTSRVLEKNGCILFFYSAYYIDRYTYRCRSLHTYLPSHLLLRQTATLCCRFSADNINNDEDATVTETRNKLGKIQEFREVCVRTLSFC